MTKQEYIKAAMQLRPTARQWRELVERAINYNGIVDYKSAKNYGDVRPLCGAMLESLARYEIYGSSYERISRRNRKLANTYHCII
jgi:hypothetical protein